MKSACTFAATMAFLFAVPALAQDKAAQAPSTRTGN